MAELDIVGLVKKLINFNTINPPGNEAEIAQYLGDLFSANGFGVHLLPYEKGRLHLVAEKGVKGPKAPLVFSGHFDTVPLGEQIWTRDPFSGEIAGNRIYGRGSSDMKSGLAAMTVAAIEATAESLPEGGVRLIFSAAEELGCQGIQQLVNTYKSLGEARALIIGEPTANFPVIGHKGALYYKVMTRGKTVHSSMPDMGDNAIYKAAKCITKIEKYRFGAKKDKLLGFPTINVGTMCGGMNLNSVPDFAEFSIDIRSTTTTNHREIFKRLAKAMGEDAIFETLVDLAPVSTPETGSFVELVYNVCGVDKKDPNHRRSVPYTTDGSVLQSIYGGVPTIILGPGEAIMAHQTDEYCLVNMIRESVTFYKNIILNKRSKND